MTHIKEGYENYKKEEALTNMRLIEHEAIMKVEKSDELKKAQEAFFNVSMELQRQREELEAMKAGETNEDVEWQ